VVSRVLNVHRNEPGVIARMNAEYAALGLNIVAQHLQTRGVIGYAITDVDQTIPPEPMQRLCGASAVIRCHLI
jgi:D-3-phosphoglycerate dehydrogenase